MTKYKVTYDHGFSTHEEILEADSLEEAREHADLKSVYTVFSVEAWQGRRKGRDDGGYNSTN